MKVNVRRGAAFSVFFFRTRIQDAKLVYPFDRRGFLRVILFLT